MRKNTKKSIIIICALFLFFFLSLMSFGIPKQDNTLYPLNLSTTPNGVYRYNYKIVPPFGTFVANKRSSVDVTVKEHMIVTVELVKPPNLRGVAEELTARIIQEQTTLLDGISGATWSKKAFLKSVELAINSAEQQR